MTLTPRELWNQAHRETGGGPDSVRCTQRYLELMREHGYLVRREPGDDSPLLDCDAATGEGMNE